MATVLARLLHAVFPKGLKGRFSSGTIPKPIENRKTARDAKIYAERRAVTVIQ